MIDLQKAYSQWMTQKSSTDLWIAQWETYRDTSAVVNAVLALGKLSGQTAMIRLFYRMASQECPITDDQVEYYENKFHEIRASKTA